jgi:hypothetical protein
VLAFATGPPAADPLPEGALLRIGSPRLRHGGLVRAVAFSADGKRLASASHDHTVSVWETGSGREVHRFRGHAADVLGVAFSPDSRVLASGGGDGVLRLWALAGPRAGQPLRAVAGKADAVAAVAFSPDGKLLATGGDDGVLRLYTPQGAPVRQVSLDRGVRCLAWSADGKVIAVNGDKNAVALFDAEKGVRLRAFGEEAPACLAFADDRTLLSAGRDASVLVWDVRRAGKKPARALAPARRERFWEILAEDNEAAALAVRRLASDPARTVGYVRARLAPPVDGQKVARLIADLDAPEYRTRTAASAALARLGTFVEGSLRRALARKPTAEQQRRLEKLLAQLADDPRNGEHRQALRAIDLLEAVGTAEARLVLEKLAGGHADAELTRLAKAALARLGER